MEIRLIDSYMPGWKESVYLARHIYREHYDANVIPNPDLFAVYFNNDHEVKACGGITMPGDNRFFSEYYLDNPVEEYVSTFEGYSVKREWIVEVGTLASISNKAGKELIRLIPLLVWCKRKYFILCTATKPLISMMAQLGIKFTPLAPALKQCIPAEQHDAWGNYYETSPIVGYINITMSTDVFMANTGRYAFRNLEVELFPTENVRKGGKLARAHY